MQQLDVAVVVAYLGVVTLLGVWIGRRARKLTDYFMPRSFGKGMMMMHAFGTGTASDQAVIVASGTFRHGLSGIWYQWLWLFNTPFYWLIAPIFRRFRAVTTADVYRLRFGPSVAVLFAIVGIVGLSVKIGVLLKGAAALIEAAGDGAIDGQTLIPVIAVLWVVYGAAGGLSAAIITDYIQGVLTVVFSFMLLPLVLNAVGGMTGVRSTISDPSMLALVAPDKIGPFFIAMFAVVSLVGIVAQPFIMGVCAAGRTEMDGRFGFVVGNLIKRVCTAAWALTGVAALAWFMQQGNDVDVVHPDRVYGRMANVFLPQVAPGMLGLFAAAAIAGVMSSCDSFMVSAAGLYTENLYKPAVANRSDAHYLWVGRAASVAIVLGGVVVARRLPHVVAGLEIWLQIAPMLGVSFWIGLFWRRYNAAGAWASALTGFACWYMTTRPWFTAAAARAPFADRLGFVWREGDEAFVYEPWQILFYLSAAVVAGVAASLATRRPDRERINTFHALIRTPIVPDERNDQPCRLPDGVQPAVRRMMFRGGDFEFPAPTATSIVGFLLASCTVGMMIASFAWLVSGA